MRAPHRIAGAWVLAAVILLSGAGLGESAPIFKECMPDFDQFQTGWSELMCGPTSAANSFHWLATRHPKLLGGLLKKPDGTAYTDDKSLIEDLAEAMVGNRDFANFPGVTIEQMAAGKRKFGRERVGFNLGVKPPTQWDAKVVKEGGSWKIDKLTRGPDLAWLRSQLDACEDVEFFITLLSPGSGEWWEEETHIVSVSGYDGSQFIIHDPNSKRASVAANTVEKTKKYFGKEYVVKSEYFDTEVVTIKGVDLYALKGYGTAPEVKWVITGGIAESPAPEPTTAALLALGTMISLLRRRGRRGLRP
jgi:hypothetical protein